ncbi:MAG: Phosphoserine phosphatase RsbU [Phycisphaerae bacterium]|nr:Phosphoserine phosphatase RsbU [Phycisphaerae bacterium]
MSAKDDPSTPGSTTTTAHAQLADHVLRLNRELRKARSQLASYSDTLVAIQRSILPQQLPGVPGLDLAVRFADVDGVGGDFYDVRPIGPGCWAIIIGDVSGHGPAAAAILALVHALGNTFPNQDAALSPGEALTLINQPLATRYLADTGKFMTAFVGSYHVETQILTYSAAGHPPPRLVRGNAIHRLDAVSGMPLGIDSNCTYRNECLQLQSGDRLVLFTDGITESTNALCELYGDERLDSVLRDPASSAAELLGRVVESARTFRAERPADDDETCLVAMVKTLQQNA